MTGPSLRDPKLAELYRRSPGAFAFVDESYRAHPSGPERAFYSMSVVTFAREPLLWAAGVGSWSAYRDLAIDDGRWIELLPDVLTVLDARTGGLLNMKQPQAAAATSRAQLPVTSKVGGEVFDASKTSA